LCKFQVHHVHAKVAGRATPAKSVQVRAVHVQQRAMRVQNFPLEHILLEYASVDGS